MGRGIWALGLVGLVLTLGAAEARADAVAPPPENCPEGSRGESSHGGPFCLAVSCTSDLSCVSGATCEPRSFCLIGTNLKVEGGACEDTSDCPSPAVCRKLQVCVEPGESGCACGEARGAGASAGLGAALACGALVMSVVRRRRSRGAR